MAPWLLWTLAALFSWGVWAVLSKLLGNALTASQSQALSTLGLVPILAPLWFSQRAGIRRASGKGLWLAFAGGIASCIGNIAYYGALAQGEKVATVVSLTALYPLVTIVLAVALLRERLRALQLAGIGLSLAAIWLFNVQAGGGWVSSTLVYAAAPIVLWGLSGFLQKVCTNSISAETAALVYLGAFVPVGIVLALIEPWPGALGIREWLLVLALGFTLGFGNLAILAAFARQGKAAVITPLSSLYPLISVPIAVTLLGETVSAREVGGICLALLSIAALSIEIGPGRDAAAVAQSGRSSEPS